MKAVTTAAVVRDGNSYEMFVVRALDGAGALLAGSLLLERGEEVMLEVSGPGRPGVVVRARVAKIVRGEEPAMQVSFQELDAAGRAALASLGSCS